MQRKDVPITQRGDLTEEQWKRIEPYLPQGNGRPFCNLQATVNGILWILRTGSPWHDLPPVYGKWNTVYKCFAKWETMGVFETLFQIVKQDADMQDVSIDSTYCKVHQHSAGAKKGGRIPLSKSILGLHGEGRTQKSTLS